MPLLQTMIVGTLRIRLFLRGSQSLKDKRRVLKSLKDRIGAKPNVAIAEVDEQDQRQIGVLGVAVVGNETAHCRSMLDSIKALLRSMPGVELADSQMELL